MEGETRQNTQELTLKEKVGSIKQNYRHDLAELELQAKGQPVSGIHNSMTNLANQTVTLYKLEFDYPVNDIIAKKNAENFSLTQSEDERIKHKLRKSSPAKMAELAKLTQEKNGQLIPLRNEAIYYGKEAAKIEREANALGQIIEKLRKRVSWHPAHNTRTYFAGQIAFGFGDALALYMTLREAGAGDNKTIILFLPLFALIMAGLAHFWSEAIIDKNKVKKWIFGSLSILILLTLVLSRLLHFNLS